jgi:hypothetical protein
LAVPLFHVRHIAGCPPFSATMVLVPNTCDIDDVLVILTSIDLRSSHVPAIYNAINNHLDVARANTD